jgi:peptidoglycan hydrolase-like amidase
VYGGYGAEHPASDAAVRATAHRVVTYDGSPAFTQFSASNGGYSAAGAYPYLAARPDPFDKYDPDGNGEGWTATFSGDQVTQHWTGLGDLESITVDERDGNGPFGGRAVTVTVHGSLSSVEVSGDKFRLYLGLRSTLIADPVATP